MPTRNKNPTEEKSLLWWFIHFRLPLLLICAYYPPSTYITTPTKASLTNGPYLEHIPRREAGCPKPDLLNIVCANGANGVSQLADSTFLDFQPHSLMLDWVQKKGSQKPKPTVPDLVLVPFLTDLLQPAPFGIKGRGSARIFFL